MLFSNFRFPPKLNSFFNVSEQRAFCPLSIQKNSSLQVPHIVFRNRKEFTWDITTTVTGLTVGDVPFSLFRKQEINFIHFDDSLARFGWDLFQCGQIRPSLCFGSRISSITRIGIGL